MSKLDAQRALREAKYARQQAAAAQRRTKAAAPAPVAPPVTAARATTPVTGAAPIPESPAPTEQLCGHRNMSGRTCTREAGHSQKSHRYS